MQLRSLERAEIKTGKLEIKKQINKYGKDKVNQFVIKRMELKSSRKCKDKFILTYTCEMSNKMYLLYREMIGNKEL